ncbi:MAG: hypothetical protein ACRD1Y_08205 [Terriglobales bacterium]
MSNTRIELAQEPGRYIGRSQARRLLATGRAWCTAEGKLAVGAGALAPGEEISERRIHWTEYSGRGGRQAFHMMGHAVNRGA